MSREQTVRDVAYAIWEAEGKPQGRDSEHWMQAEERVAASLNGDKPAKAKAPAKAKPSAEAEPTVVEAKPMPKSPAKAAATKAAPKKKA
ncbi:hypothetical protein IP69_15555 [Bosea sp. AAP35]|uniref:DUF2934 domain-containing protein n=1 Tax=Bosea sp. AAP35 TaxID=1523417 RepID=UPI0006CD638D|nr:DUF2934 domain-containing protein [Bosea sp. AAP35]KPF66278.1 hypothetical protein IP69_15555 [Bosea sp. AAP35]